MADLFLHVPHPHIAARQAAGPTRTVDQRKLNHPNPFVRFNARVGLGITLVVGTMWCAYLFTAVALVSAPAAFGTGKPIVIIAWIAQTFLQLVLLPVIIVGQNIQARAADKRAADTYNDAEAVLHEATQIQEHLKAQDEWLLKLAVALRIAGVEVGAEVPGIPVAASDVAGASDLGGGGGSPEASGAGG